MLIITEPSVRSVALQPRADAATQRHRSSASHTACVMMSGASASAKGEDRIASIVHRALSSDFRGLGVITDIRRERVLSGVITN